MVLNCTYPYMASSITFAVTRSSEWTYIHLDSITFRVGTQTVNQKELKNIICWIYDMYPLVPPRGSKCGYFCLDAFFTLKSEMMFLFSTIPLLFWMTICPACILCDAQVHSSKSIEVQPAFLESNWPSGLPIERNHQRIFTFFFLFSHSSFSNDINSTPWKLHRREFQ